MEQKSPKLKTKACAMGHSHDHDASPTGRRLLLSVGITLAFVIGEAAAGYFSNSLSLLSDAGHNFR
ncbi:MAG: cation transporter [Blastocatellia bacterium]|nr:cation transporter [Blastocatellia bacterium]